ncbi:unnamed protein product [Vicia faba]|uniref:Uncharacterized protein n=1 Tax=Vicia faba TaxID=3906 RepID=A0AAV1AKE3_VICFA|nr:unnamed protein product [Vicia faba]
MALYKYLDDNFFPLFFILFSCTVRVKIQRTQQHLFRTIQSSNRRTKREEFWFRSPTQRITYKQVIWFEFDQIYQLDKLEKEVEAYQTTICVEGRKLHNIDKRWKMEREIRGLHLRLVRINQSSPEDFLGYYSSNEISGSCCSSFVVQRKTQLPFCHIPKFSYPFIKIIWFTYLAFFMYILH